MAKPLVAIVGRPNVGKSMLFNRLVGKRLSIVEDTPGVTRDRLYAECEWCGRTFDMVDTGGIEPSTDSEILQFMREQAQIAIDAADVIVLVTDIRTGVTAADKDVANMLLRSRKPVVLAVNKADSTGPEDPAVYEFYELGLGDPIAVSAVHGHGTGELLDACLAHLPPQTDEEEEDDRIKVAVIGKPNVGKSSLINCILGEKRVIVSNVAGTTRDAVDTPFENEKGKYVFIDTAGIRRKSKVDERVEKFSVMRAQLAIERADVCVIMIDAREGVTEQDTKIAGLAHEAGKASIVVVNKWDLVEKETGTMEKMRKDVMRDLSFMSYAPILFISALTGQRTERLFELINFVNDQSNMRISTGMLNDVLADAQARVQPPTDKGRRLKIYYMTQTGIKPPNFVIFCNSRELFHFSYQRYLENQIRSVFGLEGMFGEAEFKALGCGVTVTTADGSYGVKGFAKLAAVEFVKDAFPLLIAGLLFHADGNAVVGRALAAFCLVLGRMYPSPYGFRGSYATGAIVVGAMFINLSIGLAVLAATILVSWLTKYLPLGTLAGAIVLTIAGVLVLDNPIATKLCIFITILAVIRLIPAISRVSAKSEPRLSLEEDITYKFDEQF